MRARVTGDHSLQVVSFSLCIKQLCLQLGRPLLKNQSVKVRVDDVGRRWEAGSGRGVGEGMAAEARMGDDGRTEAGEDRTRVAKGVQQRKRRELHCVGDTRTEDTSMSWAF